MVESARHKTFKKFRPFGHLSSSLSWGTTKLVIVCAERIIRLYRFEKHACVAQLAEAGSLRLPTFVSSNLTTSTSCQFESSDRRYHQLYDTHSTNHFHRNHCWSGCRLQQTTSTRGNNGNRRNGYQAVMFKRLQLKLVTAILWLIENVLLNGFFFVVAPVGDWLDRKRSLLEEQVKTELEEELKKLNQKG